MPDGSVTLPLPPHSVIRLNGFTNSGAWTQRIRLWAPLREPLTWQSTGEQTNHVVGLTLIPAIDTAQQQLTVTMDYDKGDGTGFHPHDVVTEVFNLEGLSGYIIGGQDGGGRPAGPAYWNAMVFVYWAEGY